MKRKWKMNIRALFIHLLLMLVAISTAGFAGLSFSALVAVLGFLMLNFPSTSIFMRDSGSHLLGFIIAILAIIFTSRAYDVR